MQHFFANGAGLKGFRVAHGPLPSFELFAKARAPFGFAGATGLKPSDLQLMIASSQRDALVVRLRREYQSLWRR